MTIVTKAELENAKVDAATLKDVVNGAANFNTDGTLTSRLGTELKTIAKIIADLSNQDIGESAAAQINQRLNALITDRVKFTFDRPENGVGELGDQVVINEGNTFAGMVFEAFGDPVDWRFAYQSFTPKYQTPLSKEQINAISAQLSSGQTYWYELFNQFDQILDGLYAIDSSSRSVGPLNRGCQDYAKKVYASPYAVGTNDGTSWSDAYSDLQDALDAMESGDILFTNSTRENPFIGSFTLNNVSNFRIVTDQGPSGQTWLSGANKATWEDEGSNVFSFTTSPKPARVVYDFKQDTYAGAVTGISINETKYQNAIEKFGINKQRLAAWYGFLKEVSATTAPASGEWSYSGGKIYVNPPVTSSVATMGEVCEFVKTLQNGITFTDCRDFKLTGNLVGYLYADGSVINNNGSSEESLIEGIYSIASENFCVSQRNGGPTAQNKNNQISNCLCVAHGTNSAFEFHFVSTSIDANNIGERLAFSAYPFLDTSGKALVTTFMIPLLGSVTKDVVAQNGDVRWNNCLLLDYSTKYQNSASQLLTVASNQSGGLAIGFDVSTFDTFDDYNVKCTNSRAVGLNAVPRSRVAHIGCVFDRTDEGTNATVPLVGISTGSKWFISDCLIYTGDFSRYYIQDALEGFRIDNSSIVLQSTYSNGKAGFLGVQERSQINFKLFNNEIRKQAGKNGANNVMFGISTNAAANPSTYIQSKKNRFYLPSSFQTSNEALASNDPDWWITNISTSDLFL